MHSTSSHDTRPEYPSEQTALPHSTSVYRERGSFDAIRCKTNCRWPAAEVQNANRGYMKEDVEVSEDLEDPAL